MRSLRVVSVPIALVGLLVLGCADRSDPVALAPDAPSESRHGGQTSASHTFQAHLSGAEEVPPVDTRARGQATFQLSRDGSELSYRLIVANLVDLHMAHIHVAPVGVNGPVVVWLYPAGPPPQPIPGRTSGVLATGVITADNLVGQLAGASLADLIELMASGNTYVNVHTLAHPPGEIRGQIR
jgi:hypothetical protein